MLNNYLLILTNRLNNDELKFDQGRPDLGMDHVGPGLGGKNIKSEIKHVF